MAGELANNIQPAISEFFLQPMGLLGLLALVPLIIFYLVRQKPERQIMPAMMFFMKDKKSGKAHTALRRLMRNLILLFHILLILGFAGALAHPFFESPSTSDNTVVVFDTSASMNNDIEQAREFVKSNLGGKNTLIIVDNSVEVAAEETSRRQIMNELRNTESKDVKSNIANGLELASEYSGTIIVASDLDQTVSQKSSLNIIENFRNNDRTVKVMDIQEENSWGIINIDPRNQNSSVDIKNFMEQDTDIELRKDNSVRTVSLDASSVETFNVETGTGTTTIELEEDGFEPDNTAHISIPEETKHDLVFISEGNLYFEKAIDLIDFVDIEVVSPPVERELDADIYVIGETNRVLTDTIEKIESDVEQGRSLIVFGHPGVFDLGLNSLPADPEGGYENSTVTIKQPQQISLGNMPLISADKIEGDSYASPDHALINSDYGDGKVFFYNIKDSEFRTNFLYPVFWKQILQDLVDRPSIQELNLQTGETINALEVETPEGNIETGKIEMDRAGFYKTKTHTYVANLESEAESYSEQIDFGPSVLEQQLEKRNVQNLTALILALFILGELGYLRHIGEA
jgi:hypothetical protein